MQKVEVKSHSVQKLDWKQTNGRTEVITLPPALTRSVNNYVSDRITATYLLHVGTADTT